MEPIQSKVTISTGVAWARSRERIVSKMRGVGALLLVLSGCAKSDPETVDNSAPTVKSDDKSDDKSELSRCEQNFGAACGATCTDDINCESGLYCDGQVCTVECYENSDCDRGECSANGRCYEPSRLEIDPIQTDPSVASSEPEEPRKCVEADVEFEALEPQVWLLLDRSGSMADSLGSVSRWTALGAVLLGNPDDSMDRGIVGDFEDKVAFGATFYTSGAGAGPTGCGLDLESVALSAHNYTSIRQRYNKIGPTGGTPTADSIAAVVASASSTDLTGGQKILVLATDGDPGNCSTNLDSATTAVETQVSIAFKKGIQTFAVSIASGAGATHMQRVANLGVGLTADEEPPAPYYTAESQTELRDAFSSIILDVPRSCQFALNGEVDEKNADQGTVKLAGELLDYNDADGWRLSQLDQVELLGSACDQIKEGEEDLSIDFPCAVFTESIR